MNQFWPRISHQDAHHRLGLALVVTAVVGIVLWATGRFPWQTQVVSDWLAFALTTLILVWTTILNAHPRNFKHTARIQDSSRVVIFLLVITGALASLFAVLILLDFLEENPQQNPTQHIVLSMVAVVSSWVLVHTLFTLRYAHLYYGDNPSLNHPIGGLDFPQEPEPDYLDFAYFSFIIGMTSQVSDVQITARRLRRLALLHGVLSFAFNTLIIALSINVVAGLLQNTFQVPSP